MSKETNNSNNVLICNPTPRALVLRFTEKRIYDASAVEAVETKIRSLLADEPQNMVINF